ncbi:MAG: peroxiredoxin family protein [Pyrinomonadaceae bacterium]
MKSMRHFAAAAIVSVVLALSAAAQTTLTSLDGSRVDLDGQRGKVVILAIGASWLPLSAKQAEFANTLARRYTGKDVVVYFVSTDSSSARSRNFATDDDVRKFAAANKLGVTVLRDPDGGVVMKKYNLDQIPAFVIIDKSGSQVGEALGGIDPKTDITITISRTVDKLLQ